MFDKPYLGVKHFGIWAEDVAEKLGKRDALAILENALERCRDEDVRTPEVDSALRYLERQAGRKWPFDQFRKALSYNGTEAGSAPEGRWQNLNASLNAIKRLTGAR